MHPDENTLALFMAHRSRLVDYATGIVGGRAQAEDVVQDAWLRFEEASRERFVDEPIGYLYRIVRNLAVDGRRHLQRQGRTLAAEGMDAAEATPATTPSPETAAMQRDELRRLADALDELPERTRIALEMHRFGGRKLKEIAEHLGISVTTAHTLIVEGVEHCRKRLRRGR